MRPRLIAQKLFGPTLAVMTERGPVVRCRDLPDGLIAVPWNAQTAALYYVLLSPAIVVAVILLLIYGASCGVWSLLSACLGRYH